MLHPADAGTNARLVVRGPQVLALRIVALDAATEPPTMTVEVDVSGRRYVENRDTVLLLSGSRDRTVTFTERWVFALDGSTTRRGASAAPPSAPAPDAAAAARWAPPAAVQRPAEGTGTRTASA